MKNLSPKFWLWAAGIIFIGYMTVYPTVQSLLKTSDLPKSGIQEVKDITIDELIMLRSTEAFLTFWFFAFGATVGSYLNVIVYRSPRGESLLRKRSACPQCGSKISGKDNIPVLGWILLKGKCRDCQLPISSRYPTVEATAGGLFSLFFFVELLSGGRNLAEYIPNSHRGIVWNILYPNWELIGLYVYHCYLLISILTWTLIRYDKERVNLKSYATAFSLAIIPVLIWPHIILVSYQTVPPSSWTPDIAEATFTTAVGAVIGLTSGMLIAFVLREPVTGNAWGAEQEFAASLALVGLMLGWQAALSTACISLVIRLALVAASYPLKRPLDRWPLTGALLIAVTLQLIFWRAIAENFSDWWPVTGFATTPLLVCMAAIATLVVANRLMSNVPPNPNVMREEDTSNRDNSGSTISSLEQ